jgi:hypothetical protein
LDDYIRSGGNTHLVVDCRLDICNITNKPLKKTRLHGNSSEKAMAVTSDDVVAICLSAKLADQDAILKPNRFFKQGHKRRRDLIGV